MQALDRAGDGYVRNPQTAGEVDHPRFTGPGDEFGNDLDVILRRLLRMFLPGSARMARRQGRPGWTGFWNLERGGHS